MPELQAIRKGAMKVVHQNVIIRPYVKIELYGLVNDLSQKSDIAWQHPEGVMEMIRLFEEDGTD